MYFSLSALLLQSLAILFFSHSLFLSFSLPRLSPLHSPFSFNFSVLSSPCHTFLLSCSASLSMNLCQPQRHTFPPCFFMIPTLSPSGVHPWCFCILCLTVLSLPSPMHINVRECCSLTRPLFCFLSSVFHCLHTLHFAMSVFALQCLYLVCLSPLFFSTFEYTYIWRHKRLQMLESWAKKQFAEGTQHIRQHLWWQMNRQHFKSIPFIQTGGVERRESIKWARGGQAIVGSRWGGAGW